ncbi:hypothetical protein V6N13_094512 [Hibiscus sabdariffa]
MLVALGVYALLVSLVSGPSPLSGMNECESSQNCADEKDLELVIFHGKPFRAQMEFMGLILWDFCEDHAAPSKPEEA